MGTMFEPGSSQRFGGAIRRRTFTLGRAFWALMLIMHLPAWATALWAGVTTEEFHALRLGLLTSSLALFTLKVADAPFLRLPTNRRAHLMVAVAVVLLHGNVLARLSTATDPALAATPPAFAAGVLAGSVSLVAPRVRHMLGGTRARAVRRQVRQALHVLWERIDWDGLTPGCLRRVCPCPVNRAPPR